MTEGAYPKVDGDIFYASELNTIMTTGYITLNGIPKPIQIMKDHYHYTFWKPAELANHFTETIGGTGSSVSTAGYFIIRASGGGVNTIKETEKTQTFMSDGTTTAYAEFKVRVNYSDGEIVGSNLFQIAALNTGGSGNSIMVLKQDSFETDDDQVAFSTTSAGTQTTSNIPFVRNTWYTIRIEWKAGTSVKLYIDDVLKATHTTQVPLANNVMAWYFRIDRDAVESNIATMDVKDMRVWNI